MKNAEPSGRLFQVQTALEPAEACAISRRTRFEGEASADEVCSSGSGAVQVSGRWKRAMWCPTIRPVTMCTRCPAAPEQGNHGDHICSIEDIW